MRFHGSSCQSINNAPTYSPSLRATNRVRCFEIVGTRSGLLWRLVFRAGPGMQKARIPGSGAALFFVLANVCGPALGRFEILCVGGLEHTGM